MKGLLIKSPWIEMILDGNKTWELRGKPWKYRGKIGLIKSGSKTVIGTATLKDVRGPYSKKVLIQNNLKHGQTEEEIDEDIERYKGKVYAWILEDAQWLEFPIDYQHPSGAITRVNLSEEVTDKIKNIKKIYRFPKDEIRNTFIKSLIDDLSPIHNSIDLKDEALYSELILNKSRIEFTSEELIKKGYQHILKKNLEANYEFFKKMEGGKLSIHSHFIDGKKIELDKIEPSIEICTKKSDIDLFNYCRSFQAIPNSLGAGRRILVIVRDKGQENNPIMGIISLSGAAYSLKSRDNLLKWTIENIDSYKELKKAKDDGLRKLLNLSICLPLPPYNLLYSGKLIAMIAFSSEINNVFKSKYNENLLALTTTCATGLHSPIFNRINLSNANEKLSSKQLFKRIGETSEFSSILVSKKTKKYAKELLDSYRVYKPLKNRRQNQNFSSNIDINKAIRLCGLNKEILEFTKKAVYFGAIHYNNIKLLENYECNSKTIEKIAPPTIAEITQYWKKDIMPVAFKKNKNKINKFEAKSLSVSSQLELF